MTDAEVEDAGDLCDSCSMSVTRQHGTSGARKGNLIAVQPNRIRCGVKYVSAPPREVVRGHLGKRPLFWRGGKGALPRSLPPEDSSCMAHQIGPPCGGLAPSSLACSGACMLVLRAIKALLSYGNPVNQ